MILSVRECVGEDGALGFRLANADGKGFGDVVRAVAMTGWNDRPRSNPHPALRVHPDREAAVTAAASLGRELGRSLEVVGGGEDEA